MSTEKGWIWNPETCREKGRQIPVILKGLVWLQVHDDNHFLMQVKLCLPEETQLSTYKNAASNLHKQVTKCHLKLNITNKHYFQFMFDSWISIFWLSLCALTWWPHPAKSQPLTLTMLAVGPGDLPMLTSVLAASFIAVVNISYLDSKLESLISRTQIWLIA